MAGDDRRGDVALEIGHPREAPEESAASIQADQATRRETDELPLIGEGGRDRRTVAGRIVQAFPAHGPGGFIEGNNGIAVAAAWRDDQQVSFYQRRDAITPLRDLRFELLNEILAPDGLAGGRLGFDFQAMQHAAAAHGVDVVAVNGRRGAWPGAVLRPVIRGITKTPQLAAVVLFPADPRLAFILLDHGEQAVAGNGEG